MKNGQYLVKVGGTVADRQVKTYVISAESAREAQLAAKEAFCNEFFVTGEVVHDGTKNRTTKAIISFACLLIALALSCIPWENGHEFIHINPDLLSIGYGALIYFAFVVRFKGLRNIGDSWIDIVYWILWSLVLSSVARMVLVENTISLFGIVDFTVNSHMLIISAIVMSWCGIKLVSLLFLGFTFIAGLFNIMTLSDSMGVWGVCYVVCILIGLILFANIEPAISETIDAVGNVGRKSATYINREMSQARVEAMRMKDAVAKKDDKSIGVDE